MKKIIGGTICLLALVSCKKDAEDYLTLTQWLSDSYRINSVEWIDSTDDFRNLRYTFYTNGDLLRTSHGGQVDGHYFLDGANNRLILLQEDTVEYTIHELNDVSLLIGGRRGNDTITIHLRD